MSHVYMRWNLVSLVGFQLHPENAWTWCKAFKTSSIVRGSFWAKLLVPTVPSSSEEMSKTARSFKGTGRWLDVKGSVCHCLSRYLISEIGTWHIMIFPGCHSGSQCLNFNSSFFGDFFGLCNPHGLSKISTAHWSHSLVHLWCQPCMG